MNLVEILFAHEAETGGAPPGFGLPAFVTLGAGVLIVLAMVARLLEAKRKQKKSSWLWALDCWKQNVNKRNNSGNFRRFFSVC